MESFTSLNPLRDIHQNQLFQSGDVFVLCGELFGRGYANGLVEQAQKQGMQIIGMTTGRRDANRQLRPLNPEELQDLEQRLGGQVINIPLEAGFDLDAPTGELCPADLLKSVKRDDWQTTKIDPELIHNCRLVGRQRFQAALTQVVSQLGTMIPKNANVFFAHTMAGGVPRAKIVLSVASRVFRGQGERYIPSNDWWQSSLGQICAQSFEEVTAQSFFELFNATQDIQQATKQQGKEVRFTAYGYHGTEVLGNNGYRWQTYTPYQQGHAKKQLEHFASQFWQQGAHCTVFNCPEIRTNSSDIFIGVELSLFPLLQALRQESNIPWVEQQWQICQDKLKPGANLEQLLEQLSQYLDNDLLQKFQNFEAWPQENSAELAELMIGTSVMIQAMHKNPKDLISDYLSSLVLKASGELIFNTAGSTQSPVYWLGHDLIAKKLIQQAQRS